MHRLISSLCLFAILSLTNVAADEDKIKEREAFILDLCERSVSEVAGLQMSLLIEDLDRAIKLEPKVKKRLELAAKGAALKYAEQQIEQDKAVITRQLADHLEPNADSFRLNSEVIDLSQFKIEEEPSDNEANDQIQDDAAVDVASEVYPRISFRFHQKHCGWNFRHKRGSSGYGVGGGFVRVLQTEPWKRTFDEFVSAEQQAQYQNYKNDRVSEALNEMLLGYLELQLRLTAEQRPQVKKWLKSELNVSQVDHLGDYGNLFVTTIRSLPRNGMDPILTESQSKIWLQLVNSQ